MTERPPREERDEREELELDESDLPGDGVQVAPIKRASIAPSPPPQQVSLSLRAAKPRS